MTSCNGETSNQSNQKMNYEKAMSQALSEIFQNLKEIKQDTKRQRDKLLLERRRGSAPSSILRKTTTTLQLPKNELSKSTSNMLWVLQCEEEDASWMTDWWNLAQTLNSPTLLNLTFNYSYQELDVLVMVETTKDQLLCGDSVGSMQHVSLKDSRRATRTETLETDHKLAGLFVVRRLSQSEDHWE